MTTSAPAVHNTRTANGKSPQRGFRLDVQGLRAIAVGMVVIYHLWPQRLTGGFAGVDVFFVISGFLITGHLLRDVPEKPAHIATFWARRIRRLLPASLLVLAVTAVGTWMLAPSSTWETTARQIVASVFYVGNWDLAFSSVDYLAADNAPSPVQHFWSLGVEEQFYIVWPILFLMVALLVRRSVQRKRALFGLVAVVVVASFAYSVWLTATEPAAAYFVTPTRMWELAIGGLVAIAVTSTSFARFRQFGLAAWVGLGLVIFSAFWIDGTMPFPGTVAAIPVVGTALVLFTDPDARLSPARLLSVRPMRFIGDISYAVYLWHWPLIVLAPAVTGTVGLLDKGIILAATILLAWLTTKYVEPVFRTGAFWKPLRHVFIGALIATLVVAGGATALAVVAANERAASQARIDAAATGDLACFGAAALPTSAGGPGGCDITGDELLLNPVAAKTDKSQAYEDGCWSWGDFTNRPTCTYGDGPTQVALVGNSHAGQWLAPLVNLAEQRGWTITTFLVDRCNATVDIPLAFDTPAKTEGCQSYADEVRQRTTSGEFDAVITSQRQSAPIEGGTWEDTEPAVAESQERMLQAWSDADVPVFVIRDTPFPGAENKLIPDCVASHLDDVTACNASEDAWYWMDPLATAAADFPENTTVVDPTSWLCPDGECHAVIGGVITFFDGSHITNTYAATLTPFLAKVLDDNPRLGL